MANSPIIRVVVDVKEDLLDDAFSKAMQSYYALPSCTIQGDDKVFLNTWLYQWMRTMLERREAYGEQLERGEWTEYFISSQYSTQDVRAVLVLVG